jgi:prevent-host-death family protein
MTMSHYTTFNEARIHLKDLLDAAEEGKPATVVRESRRVAVVDAVRLRDYLARLGSLKVEAVAEADGWSLFLPGVPVATDGATFEEAVEEMIDALREYADDWAERLRVAPNHAGNWALVQLVSLSDDEQLRAWIVGE